MIDGFGRNIDYIRISLTDRCNLRCVYCMPEEGVPFLPHNEILSYEEILRIATILASQGVSKIKLTGGEPLVRKGVPEFVKKLKQVSGIENVTITTNALLLEGQMDALHDTGIDAVNISIDSVDSDHYAEMVRHNGVDKVLSAIDRALTLPNWKVKLNCVPILGMNDHDLVELALLAKDRDLAVRFIELMPIGFGRTLECMDEAAIRAILEPAIGTLTHLEGKFGNGPSEYYQPEGFTGKIGFISAVSHTFCDQCNRVRMTADGFFKTCLQYDYGISLKELLRDGSSDEKILSAIQIAMQNKPEEHEFSAQEHGDNIEVRTMSQIG